MDTEKYYQPEIETMSRPELEKLQVERLKKTIEIAMKSPFMANFTKKKALRPTLSKLSTIFANSLLLLRKICVRIIRSDLWLPT